MSVVIDGYPLNIVWRLDGRWEGKFAKIYDYHGQKNVIETRGQHVQKFLRHMWANRPDLIWVEDGCPMFWESHFYNITEDEQNPGIHHVSFKPTAQDEKEEYVPHGQCYLVRNHSNKGSDLSSMLSLVGMNPSDYITTMTWPCRMTEKHKRCFFKDICHKNGYREYLVSEGLMSEETPCTVLLPNADC